MAILNTFTIDKCIFLNLTFFLWLSLALILMTLVFVESFSLQLYKAVFETTFLIICKYVCQFLWELEIDLLENENVCFFHLLIINWHRNMKHKHGCDFYFVWISVPILNYMVFLVDNWPHAKLETSWNVTLITLFNLTAEYSHIL